MPRQVVTFFDFASPFSYLGATQIAAMCERHGAAHTWHPLLLGAIFKEIGTPMVPMMAFGSAKRSHAMLDLARYAEQWEIPFRWPTRFPMVTVRPLRVVLAVQRMAPELTDAVIQRIYRAFWADDRDISDGAVLAELLDDLGLDGPALIEQTGDPAIKQSLFDSTRAAIDAGVFGVPTFVIDGKELLWGQDRLTLVEWYLSDP